MTFEKSHLGYFVAFLLVGAILGSALGTLVVRYVPALSVIQNNLTGPIGVNLDVIDFHIRINLSAIIGTIVGFFIFWKV